MESGVVHDADRLAAMSTGNTLGGLLLRLRESEQPQWARRIVLILARRIANKHHLGLGISARIATAALEEFYRPHCVACNGARETMFGNVKVTCDACDGSGKQRWSNDSRRARIGTYGRRIDEAMADAHKDMSNALAAYLGNAAWRLE